MERTHDEARKYEHPMALDGMTVNPRRTRARWRGMALLLAALLALGMPVLAAANQHGADPAVELIMIFPVTDPPDAPYTAVQMVRDFAPGAEAALHRHGGPGYITVISGEMTLFADGVETVYQGGDSFIETSDVLYKGGNYSDQDVRLMVTYLIPDGEEVTLVVDDPDAPDGPDQLPDPVTDAMHHFTDPPDEFDLTHIAYRINPGAGVGTRVVEGDIILAVAEGTLTATVDGAEQALAAGDSLYLSDGQEFSLSNGGDADAMVVTSEFGPLVISALVPATGGPAPGSIVYWVLAFGALGLLGAGIGLRFATRRPVSDS